MSLEIFELIQILLAILGAFVSEDMTLITLSTLKASGKIDPMVYFIGAIVGIVLSDVFLYTVGRFWESKKKSFLWINFEKLKDKVDEYKGSKFLFIFFARFIPGTRFPTYVSAGITKYPFYLFLPTILTAIFIWVYLFSIFGKLLFEKISENKWQVLLIFILLIVFVRIILYYKNIKR
jgi:membrane protein DedA with SNARE-associated domain